MPGAYAHITLADSCRALLRKHPAISGPTASAISAHLGYVELGAVSPDYPYLGRENDWADLMHHQSSADFLRHGVAHIQTLHGTPRNKLTAWLFGFAAHIAADVTIHPVVNELVGPYAQNKNKHRECEMHQDAHVFQRLNVGDTGVTQHLTGTIALCVDPANGELLDPDIALPWQSLLQRTYPDRHAQSLPALEKWQGGFSSVMNAIRRTNKLLPFARHLTAGLKVNYPKPGTSDPRFLKNLPTPLGDVIDYDLLFDKAIANVMALWEVIDGGLSKAAPEKLDALAAWDLDTGLDVADKTSVYWRAGA